MKRLFLTAMLFFEAMFVVPYASVTAQGLESYKEICVETRNAIKTENLLELVSCKDRLKKMEVWEYSKEEFVTVRPEKEGSLEGHVQFHYNYLVELIKVGFAKRDSIPVDLHVVRRGDYDAIIAHRVVPANGEGVYRFWGRLDMEIVVISEDETPIEIKIECMGGEVEYEGKDSLIPGCQEYKWIMGEDFSEVLLTVKNPSSSPVCCVIATN